MQLHGSKVWTVCTPQHKLAGEIFGTDFAGHSQANNAELAELHDQAERSDRAQKSVCMAYGKDELGDMECKCHRHSKRNSLLNLPHLDGAPFGVETLKSSTLLKIEHCTSGCLLNQLDSIFIPFSCTPS